MLNVATKIGGWGEQGRFTTWLHVVAVNSARSTYRRLRNQAVASDVLPLEKPDPRTTSVIAGTRLDLLEAMETLEQDHPQYVEPLLLRDVYGLRLRGDRAAGGGAARHREGPDPPRAQAGAPAAPGPGVRRRSAAAVLAAATALAVLTGLTACTGDASSTAGTAGRPAGRRLVVDRLREPLGRRERRRRRRPRRRGQRPRRGQRLPRRRRPLGRRPALRPRPRLGARRPHPRRATRC